MRGKFELPANHHFEHVIHTLPIFPVPSSHFLKITIKSVDSSISWYQTQVSCKTVERILLSVYKIHLSISFSSALACGFEEFDAAV